MDVFLISSSFSYFSYIPPAYPPFGIILILDMAPAVWFGLNISDARYDALTGKVTTVGGAGMIYERGYTLGEVPMWFRSGSIIPYLPLKSLKSLVGVAVQQYNFLGFRVVPGAATASTRVYEDDGSTTAYLDGKR